MDVRRLIALWLIVAVVGMPTAAFATEWMPGMGTVPGSGTYLDYQPWRFTEQIEAYNDYAMWQQQLKLPASQRVANSFVEFQGKVRAGYRGVSVNQAASIYSTSAEKVVAWAQRTKDYLKRAPGSRALAKTPKGGMLAAGVMGVLIDVAATEGMDALIGERTALHADGSVCTAPFAVMCPHAWTGPHYYHYTDGLLTDGERIPPELASLFPGFETFLDVGGVPVYSFTAKEGVVRPQQPGDANAYGMIPAFVILNSAYYRAEWTEDTGWLMSRVLAASFHDAPLMPSWGIGDASSNFTGSFRNMLTGAVVKPSHAEWRGADLHTPTGYYAVDGNWTLYNRSNGAAWAAARQWYEAQIATMIANGTVVETTAPAESKQVDPLPVPMPSPSSLPAVGVFNGDDYPGGLTFDDPLADWVDAYDTPGTLPTPIETGTGVDSDEQGYRVVLAPAIDEVTEEARRRWPYAAVGMLFDPDVSPNEGPEVVAISFPLPVPDNAPQPPPVEIDLGTALEPLKPYRPIAAALVAVTTFAAMWAILKPELHV